MNLNELRGAVRERCAVTALDALAADAPLTTIVNAAMHRIEARNPNGWSWLHQPLDTFPTVAGTDRYLFTTTEATTLDVSKVGSVWITVGSEQLALPRVELGLLYRLYPLTTQGRPEQHAVKGQAFWLRPVPDAVYTVTYEWWAREPLLSSNENTPLMPVQYHDAIVEQAAALLYRRLQAEAAAAEAQRAADEWVQLMLGHERPVRGPGRVGAAAGFETRGLTTR